jgi:hypothetical protein
MARRNSGLMVPDSAAMVPEPSKNEVLVRMGPKVISIAATDYQLPQASRWLTYDNPNIEPEIAQGGSYMGPNLLNEMYTVVAIDKEAIPGKTRIGLAYGLWPRPPAV